MTFLLPYSTEVLSWLPKTDKTSRELPASAEFEGGNRLQSVRCVSVKRAGEDIITNAIPGSTTSQDARDISGDRHLYALDCLPPSGRPLPSFDGQAG